MTTTTGSYETRGGPEAVAVSQMLPADGARSRVAWAAIFAGAVIVIATEILLNALGAGVGLGLVNPTGTPSAGSFGVGAGVWIFISTIISFVLGGYVAGRLAGTPTRFDGVLHGLTLWGLTLIAMVWLLSSAAGGIIGGAFHLVGGAASLAGQGVSAAAPQVAQASGLSQDALQNQLQAYMAPVNDDPSSMTPQEAQKAIAMEAPNLAAGGDRAAAARQRIIPIIAAQQHISNDEAARRFDNAQAKFVAQRNQVEAQAAQAAEASASAVSKASFLTFGALLIGAIAAGVGGAIAAPRLGVVATRRVV